MEHVSNDNGERQASAGQMLDDGHGRAALLLVESLVHSLVTRNLLNVADVKEILDGALDIGVEIDADSDHQSSTRRAVVLLSAISSSFQIDLSKT